MNRSLVYELSDCSEIRQTLQSRPPAIVHATAALLVLLLAAALVWAALVKANLVVKAPGRVRPVDAPAQVFLSAASETESRVTQVHFDEGGRVTKGQVLLRLDTQQLDNKIAQRERQIAAAQEELDELNRLEVLMQKQFASAHAKAQTELRQAEEALKTKRQQQASQVRQARTDLRAAEDRLQRCRKVYRHQAVSEERLLQAETEVRQAEEKLHQAQLPVDAGQVHVLRQQLRVVSDEFPVRLAELEVKRVAQQGQIDAAGKELANLLLAREQAVLRAPVDGIVVSGQMDVGDVLKPGTPVVEIAQQDGFRFEMAVASSDVGDLELGMPVKIKFDAYDYQKYGTLAGKICFIAPDSQVSQSHQNEQPPSTSPIAYVVRVEVQRDEVGRGAIRGKVKLGLGGTAEIVTGRESILAILLKRIRRTISFG